MDIDSMTIGEFKKLSSLFESQQETIPDGYYICVLHRGWIFVGKLTSAKGIMTISNGKCIRRWSTGAGLVDLARTGKSHEVILDSSENDIIFATEQLVFAVQTKEELWM